MSLSTKGDRKYAAPEVYLLDVREKLAPYRQDIYSFGLIACEMMAKEFPSKAQIANRDVKFFPGYSKDLIELVYSMLDKNPVTRPTITDIQKSAVLCVEMMTLLRS